MPEIDWNEAANIVNVVGPLVGFVLAPGIAAFYIIREDLKDQVSCQQLAKWFRHPKWDAWYEEALKKALRWCKRFFGVNGLTSLSYDRCLIVSILYAFGFFILSWAFSNQTTVTPDILGNPHPLKKLLSLVTLACSIFLLFLAILFGKNVLRKISSWELFVKFQEFIFGNRNHDDKLRIIVSSIILSIFLSALCSFSIIIVTSVFGYINLRLSILVSVPFFLSIAAGFLNYMFDDASKKGAIFATMIGAFSALIILFSGAIADRSHITTFVYFFLFWLFLPVTNATLDWVSWCVSRWLAAKLVGNRGWVRIFGHLFADLVLATMFLFTMAAILPMAFAATDQLGQFANASQRIGISAQLGRTVVSPFGPNGIWITVMLLSTLVPTVLHMGAALAAIPTLVMSLKWRTNMADLLYAPWETKNGSLRQSFAKQPAIKRDLIVFMMVFSAYVGLLLAIMVLLLFAISATFIVRSDIPSLIYQFSCVFSDFVGDSC